MSELVLAVSKTVGKSLVLEPRAAQLARNAMSVGKHACSCSSDVLNDSWGLKQTDLALIGQWKLCRTKSIAWNNSALSWPVG